MRVAYYPEADKVWTQYYMNQATQSGAGFIGMPYQRGSGLGSVFRGIFRALMPFVKSAGKSIGRQALSTGAQIASDLAAGKPIKETAKRHGSIGASQLLQQAAAKLAQQGSGLRRKRRTATRKPAIKKRKTAKKGTKRKKKKTTKRRSAKKVKFADQLGFYYK